MTEGVQVIAFGTDPDADGAFAGEVLGLTCVEAGGGWLVFALPGGGTIRLHETRRKGP
jgi:hypothetical protein